MLGSWGDMFLIIAGSIGLITALVHGFLMQQHIVKPVQALIEQSQRLPRSTARLISPLMHVSTLAWSVMGALLVWAGFRATDEACVVLCIAAVAIFGHASIANFRATRGRHPGWLLMALAVMLAGIGATQQG